MSKLALLPSLLLLASVGACAAAFPDAQPPCAACASAAPSSALAPAVASGVPAASASAYGGHGVESLPPEVLAEFRPKPLLPEVSRRIQSLIDVSGPSAGEVSSDGKALFFTWNVTGVPQIWRIDGPGRFPRQLTGGEDATTLFAVTPDGKTLVLSRDRAGEENPGIYLQSAGGGELRIVQHDRGVQCLAQVLSEDGSTLYYVANDQEPSNYAVYRYDLAKRLREKIWGEPGLWRVADVRGNATLLLQRLTGALTSEVHELDLATKQLKPLLGVGQKEEYAVRYAKAPGELVVSTNARGDFRRLYRFAQGTLTALGKERNFDVSGFSVSGDRKRVIYGVNEGGYSRFGALDTGTWRELAPPKLPTADHVYFGATSANGRYTSLAIDDGKAPPRAYVLDWQASRLTPWHEPSTPELDTSSFARATLEHYSARDGAKIPVFVRRPARCSSDPCAVILAFHGGPEAQAKPGFSTHAQAFVDRGFVFAEPNVRGSDGYGKAYLAADDGPKRLGIITDVEDAATWARQAFASNGKAPKLGVYGGSYGGYTVLMAMTRFAGAYDAGVNVVGISDLRTFLRNTAPYRRALRISEYGDPERDAKALEELSPMTYIARARGPLLTLQGATDPRVPAGEAVQIHRAWVARAVPSELMIFPDEGHGAKKRGNRVLMLGHAVAFFERQLLGR